jgi:oligopeptide/dipeptide ABC transporter ATP-binding protein
MTVRAILHLLPISARLTARTLKFDGTDLLTLGEHEMEEVRGRLIGYVPQDPLSSLNPVLSVGDQITEPLRMHDDNQVKAVRVIREILRGYGVPLGRRKSLSQATEMLAHVGIPDPETRAKQLPHQFSGGMRQRAIIASALCLSPRLVIADEPTTALDATVQAQILDLLARLREEQHAALLLVSHDLNLVSWNCDYVYVLYQGRLLEEGTVASLFQDPRQPYTLSLIAATPDLDQPPVEVEKIEVQQKRSVGCPFASRCPNVVDLCWREFPRRTIVSEYHSFWCHNPVTL